MQPEHDRYELREELGRGGSASVVRAYDRVLERFVALKVLSGPIANDPEFMSRFEREARLAARLDHSNIVTIYDFGRFADGRAFIAMGLLTGRGLEKVIAQDWPLKPEVLASIISQVADALDYTHSMGMVHRDIKPNNVIVDARGKATLTDFGIARAFDSARVTMTGLSIGTPRYMAPEQIRGEDVTASADIYSLGVMTFEMLAGRGPFQGEGTALMYKIVHEPPPPLTSVNPKVRPSVGEVVARAIEKRPEDRWSSAGEMAAALSAALLAKDPPPQVGESTMISTSPTGSTPTPTGNTPPPTHYEEPAAGTGERPVSRPSTGSAIPAIPAQRAPAVPPVPEAAAESAAVAPLAGPAPASLAAGAGAEAQPRSDPATPTTQVAGVLPGPDLASSAPARPPTPFDADPPTTPPPSPAPVAAAWRDEATIAGGARSQAPAGAPVGLPGDPNTSPEVAQQPFGEPMTPAGRHGRGMGNGRLLLLSVLVGAVIAGVAGVILLVLGSGGGKSSAGAVATTPAATTTAATGSTAAAVAPASAPAGPEIRVLDRWDYSFRITTNTCSYGPAVGDRYAVAFRYQPADGGGTTIKVGDRVRVVAVLEKDVSVGTFTFNPDFVVTYPVAGAQGQRGTATLHTSFANDQTIAQATLSEVYDAAGCRIDAQAAS